MLDQMVQVLFQPVVDIRGARRILGFEALSRFPKAAGGPKGPEEVLEQAWQKDKLLLIERALRRAALSAVGARPIKGHDPIVFVNVDTRIAHDEAFRAGFTAQLCEEFQIDPKRIVLELTERDASKRQERLARVAETFAEDGFAVALDELDADYSSLTLATTCPCAYIKLRRSVVHGIADSPENANMVEALCRFAASEGIKVIAAGVEREADLARVKQLGANYAQGFLIGRPLPLSYWKAKVETSGAATSLKGSGRARLRALAG
ncbi:MAG: EAL domain-containing protein [Myxococcota bacterium]